MCHDTFSWFILMIHLSCTSLIDFFHDKHSWYNPMPQLSCYTFMILPHDTSSWFIFHAHPSWYTFMIHPHDTSSCLSCNKRLTVVVCFYFLRVASNHHRKSIARICVRNCFKIISTENVQNHHRQRNVWFY